MDNHSDTYLNVPVTDAERFEARRRQSNDDSTERLLDESTTHKPYTGPNISRFPSIHPPGSRYSSFPRIQRPPAAQYDAISPIEEEEAVGAIPLPQRVFQQAEKSSQPSEPFKGLWIPIWLRRSTLGLFALLFTLLLIVLVVLEFRSRATNGFSVASSTSHYTWTYGPTAVLVILVALWRQVDYNCKLLVPWDELQNGPVTASKSLLLDYISPFQLVSLFQAFKQGHIPIIITISSFMLLKLITLFSTALLVLLPTTVSKSDFPVTVTSKFDTSSFDPRTPLVINTFPTSPLYAYYGTLTQGLPLPAGVTMEMAYNPLGFDSRSGTNLPPNATLFGEADAFVPLMECHEMDVQLDGPATIEGSDSDNAYGPSDSQSLILKDGDLCNHWSYVGVPIQNPQLEIVPSSQVVGTWQNVYCSVNNYSQVDLSKAPEAMLYTMMEVHYKQDLFANASDLVGGSYTIANNTSRSVVRMTNVICKPSYTMGRVNVTNNTTTSDLKSGIVSLSPVQKTDNSTLPSLSNWNATALFETAVYASKTLFETSDDEDDKTQASITIFTLMALNYQTPNISILFDSEKLINSAQKSYKGILSQYVAQRLTSPSDTLLKKSRVTFNQNRLHFNQVSLGLMIAGFGLLAIASATLVFTGPKAVVPRDPSSIAALATTLARSIELNRLLRRRAIPNEESQKFALLGYEFGTAIATTESGSSSFKIVTSEGEHQGTTPSPKPGLKWWLPITASIPIFIITIALPVAVIIVLEILQNNSDKHHGLYSVADNDWTHDYSRYIPALVMLIIATLVNAIDFNIALFAPWSKLSEGNATSKVSVLSHIVGQSPPFAFWEAFQSRSIGAILSLTAALVASTLTIVVSGLYSIENFPSTGPNLSTIRLDSFKLTLPNSYSSDNGAGAVTNLIEHLNVSYPDFTYDGLVLPKFSVQPIVHLNNSESVISGPMSAVLPALRGNLRCDIIASSAVKVRTAKAGESAYDADESFVTVDADLPTTCKLGGYQGNQSSFSFEANFELPSGGQSTYSGKQLDLLFGQNASIFGSYGEEHGPYIGDNPPVGCPSLAFVFGQFQLGKIDSKEVTAMVCYQEIQQVHANFTFKANTTVIDQQHPPVVDESSVIRQTNPNSTIGSKSFDFRIQENLARQMTLFNTGSISTTAESNVMTNTFDVFFQAALNGTRKHDPASLAGQQNEQKLFQAIQSFYRIYMAQVIHANMREPITTASNSNVNSRDEITDPIQRRQSSAQELGDMSTTITTTRLVQHNGSKLALQILLGVTILCTIIAYIITKMRRVVPCNPCSIAGAMSLLAGSDLCHTHDDGICECCGRPRRRSFSEKFKSIHSNGEPQISIAADDDDDDNIHGERSREQTIVDNVEWLDKAAFRMAFSGKRYSMGWWRELRSHGRRRRFGVDIGARTDGSDDQDWELGQRRPAGEAFGDFMMRGGLDGRGTYHAQQDGRLSPDPTISSTHSVRSAMGPRRGRGLSMSDISEEA